MIIRIGNALDLLPLHSAHSSPAEQEAFDVITLNIIIFIIDVVFIFHFLFFIFYFLFFIFYFSFLFLFFNFIYRFYFSFLFFIFISFFIYIVRTLNIQKKYVLSSHTENEILHFIIFIEVTFSPFF